MVLYLEEVFCGTCIFIQWDMNLLEILTAIGSHEVRDILSLVNITELSVKRQIHKDPCNSELYLSLPFIIQQSSDEIKMQFNVEKKRYPFPFPNFENILESLNHKLDCVSASLLNNLDLKNMVPAPHKKKHQCYINHKSTSVT